MSWMVFDAVRAAKDALLAKVADVQGVVNTINAKQAGIKSVQRGVASPVNGTMVIVTVSAVNMGKSMLLVCPYENANSSMALICGGQLISPTEIKIFTTIGGGYSIPAAWQLVEFF